MNYNIDFSIFASPTDAYGNVTGEIDLPRPPEVGQPITLLDGVEQQIDHLIPLGDDILVGLNDVVFGSRQEAERFGSRLETILGLFCVVYGD